MGNSFVRGPASGFTLYQAAGFGAGSRLQRLARFLEDGVFVAPYTGFYVFDGFGAGGPGGGGARPDVAAPTIAAGAGAGGGSAIRSVRIALLTAGVAYPVAIGQPAPPPTGATVNGTSGNSGGLSGGTTIQDGLGFGIAWEGAVGGAGGRWSATQQFRAFPGPPDITIDRPSSADTNLIGTQIYQSRSLGYGGLGGRTGTASQEAGFQGNGQGWSSARAAAGAAGVDGGGAAGGSGGGSGATGGLNSEPGLDALGGIGGNGGDGSATNGTNGQNGGDAPDPNSGAGGGGGGAGGNGLLVSGDGGNAGKASAGRLDIYGVV